MQKERSFVVLLTLGSVAGAAAAGCGGGDSCVAAKQHMCERIPDMGCSTLFMDSAQAKIATACGQAELAAYIPVVENACSASQAAGFPMDCSAIAAKTYATASDASSGCTTTAPPKRTLNSGQSAAMAGASRTSSSPMPCTARALRVMRTGERT